MCKYIYLCVYIFVYKSILYIYTYVCVYIKDLYARARVYVHMRMSCK